MAFNYRALLTLLSISSIASAAPLILSLENPPDSDSIVKANDVLYKGSYTCTFDASINNSAIGIGDLGTVYIPLRGLNKIGS